MVNLSTDGTIVVLKRLGFIVHKTSRGKIVHPYAFHRLLIYSFGYTFTLWTLTCSAALSTAEPYIKFLFVISKSLLATSFTHNVTVNSLWFTSLGGKYLCFIISMKWMCIMTDTQKKVNISVHFTVHSSYLALP